MKKIFVSIILFSGTYIFSACNGNNSSSGSGTGSDSATAVANTDSSASADKMAATSNTDSGKAVINGDTKDFANKAAAGGMAEVELGKLAEQKATDPRVKDFATMMVNDHTLANNTFKTLATSKHIELPASVTAGQQKDIDALSKKSGKDFDKAYVDMMVDDHKATIMEFKSAEGKVSDSDVKNFITLTLPTLEKHLDAIQAIKSKM